MRLASWVPIVTLPMEELRLNKGATPIPERKNWEIRVIPVIPDMRRLLERIHSEKDEAEWLKRQSGCRRARNARRRLTAACKKLGITRFTHHDLRHLFATRCIESGVDIPTVSRWLGHSDGGALQWKLTDTYAISTRPRWRRKSFLPKPLSNVVPLPSR